jgi:hypothetical protein
MLAQLQKDKNCDMTLRICIGTSPNFGHILCREAAGGE